MVSHEKINLQNLGKQILFLKTGYHIVLHKYVVERKTLRTCHDFVSFLAIIGESLDNNFVCELFIGLQYCEHDMVYNIGYDYILIIFIGLQYCWAWYGI